MLHDSIKSTGCTLIILMSIRDCHSRQNYALQMLRSNNVVMRHNTNRMCSNWSHKTCVLRWIHLVELVTFDMALPSQKLQRSIRNHSKIAPIYSTFPQKQTTFSHLPQTQTDLAQKTTVYLNFGT